MNFDVVKLSLMFAIRALNVIETKSQYVICFEIKGVHVFVESF